MCNAGGKHNNIIENSLPVVRLGRLAPARQLILQQLMCMTI